MWSSRGAEGIITFRSQRPWQFNVLESQRMGHIAIQVSTTKRVDEGLCKCNTQNASWVKYTSLFLFAHELLILTIEPQVHRNHMSQSLMSVTLEFRIWILNFVESVTVFAGVIRTWTCSKLRLTLRLWSLAKPHCDHISNFVDRQKHCEPGAPSIIYLGPAQ